MTLGELIMNGFIPTLGCNREQLLELQKWDNDRRLRNQIGLGPEETELVNNTIQDQAKNDRIIIFSCELDLIFEKAKLKGFVCNHVLVRSLPGFKNKPKKRALTKSVDTNISNVKARQRPKPKFEEDHSLDELEHEKRRFPLLPGSYGSGKHR